MVSCGNISDSVYGMAEIGDVPNPALVAKATPNDVMYNPIAKIMYLLNISLFPILTSYYLPIFNVYDATIYNKLYIVAKKFFSLYILFANH